MPQKFCTHLDEYRVLFVRAEAAYRAFNAMMDRVVLEPDDANLAQALDTALQDWQLETKTLRSKFVELFKAEKIKLPRGALNSGHHHSSSPRGPARCSECLCEIPRLDFPEWQLAHNGTVNFRGEEWAPSEAEPVLTP